MKVVNTTLPLQTHTYTYILHFFFMFPLYRLSMEAIILQISTTFGYSEIAKEGYILKENYFYKTAIILYPGYFSPIYTKFLTCV